MYIIILLRMNQYRKDMIDDRMVEELHYMGTRSNNRILHKNTYKKQITEKIE